MRPERIGGIAGVLGWLLYFIGFAMDPTPPTLGASAAELVSHSASHQHTMQVAAFLFASSSPLFLVWGAAFAKLMRDHEGKGGWLWLAFISGNSVGWGLQIVASFIWFTLAGRGWRAGGAIAEVQGDLVNCGYIFAGFGALLLVPLASQVIARTGMLPKRLGQLGYVVTAAMVVFLITSFFSAGLMAGGGLITIAGFTILGLWILAVSIAMIAKRQSR